MIRNVALAALCAAGLAAAQPAAAQQRPILFVTQVPVTGFTVVGSAFGAHLPDVRSAPRGGDLYIRYPDGSLRNLTAEAGYGRSGSQNGSGIAVRQPVVHWDGSRALFSMVVGAPRQQYEVDEYWWQLYEVTGLQQGGTATITKLPCQPARYNNIAPAYASDEGQVIFISDRPRSGQRHLYPQRDEYESTSIDTGLWKLDRASCQLRIIEHAPSGVSYPTIDSYGRVIFTKWDHLQRDQQADADVFDGAGYGAFTYPSEANVPAPAERDVTEHFPEFRDESFSLLPGQGYDGHTIAPDYPFSGHTFNHFFPWMVNQDGSEEETLNHIGRHEIGGSYTEGSYRLDPVQHYIQPGQFSGATSFLFADGGMFHIREDGAARGRYWGIRAPEFSTLTGGDLIRLQGAPTADPEQAKITIIGNKDRFGRFRNPLATTDGRLLVVHTPHPGFAENTGTLQRPDINYRFRIREFTETPRALGPMLTAGIEKCAAWWSPDVRINWCGTLWELDPVEVVARPVPRNTLQPPLPPPEMQVLSGAGVDPRLLRNWLHSRDLALIVSRDVTTRDRADRQQPFNLRVRGGTRTIGEAGARIYDITHLQLFQGDQLRGYHAYGSNTVTPGRRILATPLHDPAAVQAMGGHLSGPPSSVPIGADGSMAAFVPARRAMAWQLIDAQQTGWEQPIVRERNWLSFKPGETRVCASCHGLNRRDQDNHVVPQNPPQALGTLLAQWKDVVRNSCPATGGTGTWGYGGVEWSACDEGRQYRIQACRGGACCDGLPATTERDC